MTNEQEIVLEIEVDNSDVNVGIDVQDVDSSILDGAIASANSAADRAEGAAAEAESAAEAARLAVDIHQGPPGESAYQLAVDNGFVGTEEEWLASLKGDDGGPGAAGVGFDSVSTQQDGTMVIRLTNGNTMTINLIHAHPQYPKYVLCADEAEYNAITNKDSATLYLIPET